MPGISNEASARKDVRLWRIHVWIVLAQVIQLKEGRFPETLKPQDVFPEMKLFANQDMEIWLFKNKHPNRKDSNYLLEAKVKAKTAFEALQLADERMESVLNMLAFQLQFPVRAIYTEAMDFSKPIEEGEEREWSYCPNGYPSVNKDAYFNYMTRWDTMIDVTRLGLKTDKKTEAALRWFAKGLSSSRVVDQFTAYWIALEITISKLISRSKRFFRCSKCGFEMRRCPRCKHSTKLALNMKQRITAFIIENLGKSKHLADKLWQTRMIFHGRNKLTSEEVNIVSEMTWELRLILIEAIKKKLMLGTKERPRLLSPEKLSILSTFVINSRRKIDAHDLIYR